VDDVVATGPSQDHIAIGRVWARLFLRVPARRIVTASHAVQSIGSD